MCSEPYPGVSIVRGMPTATSSRIDSKWPDAAPVLSSRDHRVEILLKPRECADEKPDAGYSSGCPRLSELTQLKNYYRGRQSPDPQRRGRPLAVLQFLQQHESVASLLQTSLAQDSKSRRSFSSCDDSESQSSTVLITPPTTPCMLRPPAQLNNDAGLPPPQDTAAADATDPVAYAQRLHAQLAYVWRAARECGSPLSRTGPHKTDVACPGAAMAHSPSPSILKDSKGLHLKIPRRPLPSCGADLQEGNLRDRRGESSPDPRRRHMAPRCLERKSAVAETSRIAPRCLERESAVAETIEVLSLAGEVLCTLDGSAKRLTTRELKLLIKDHTGICIDYQELLNGDESLPDWPGKSARPLEDVSAPLTLTLVRSEPLPTFRAPV